MPPATHPTSLRRQGGVATPTNKEGGPNPPLLGLFHRAVAAVSPSVIVDGLEQIFPGKIRPELRGDVHLRVGKLPEQKIREAHFAGSTDQQVGIGIVARV